MNRYDSFLVARSLAMFCCVCYFPQKCPSSFAYHLFFSFRQRGEVSAGEAFKRQDQQLDSVISFQRKKTSGALAFAVSLFRYHVGGFVLYGGI